MVYPEVVLLNCVWIFTAFPSTPPIPLFLSFHVVQYASEPTVTPPHVISGEVSFKGSVEMEHLVPL